jgi:ribose-phosphate pyrophosphokinase
MLKVSSIRNFKSNFRQSPFMSNNAVAKKTDYIKYQYNLNSDTISFKKAHFDVEDKKIFSCADNKKLAEKISESSDIDLCSNISKKFKNGETYVRLTDNVDEKSVFLINAGNDPINDNLMEFYQMIDAAKRNGAEKVTAILPYLPYSRQDRISASGEALTARLVADSLEKAGADKIITLDLHSVQIQGFYDIPVKNLSAVPLFADYFRSKGNIEDLVVVSPDVGGIKRAEALSVELKSPMAVIYKKREEHNVAKAVDILGDIEGKNCILVDDMIDTAGTITEAVKMLKSKGAKDVYICATHGIFSDNAYENIKNCPVKEVVVTNTLPLKDGAPVNIKQLNIAPLIAKEISN